MAGHNERPNVKIVKAILDYLKDNVDREVGEHLIKHVVDRKAMIDVMALTLRKLKMIWVGIRKLPLKLVSGRPLNGTLIIRSGWIM